jgi:hypothetical protein
MLPDNVALATLTVLTSLLPRFPLERLSCHVFHWNVSLATFVKMYRNCHVNVALATLTSLLPRFPLERHSCHVCEDVCRNCHVNVGLATLTSLLPRFPLERLSCHVFHWNVALATFVKMYVSIATFVKMYVAIATFWKLGFPLQRSP